MTFFGGREVKYLPFIPNFKFICSVTYRQNQVPRWFSQLDSRMLFTVGLSFYRGTFVKWMSIFWVGVQSYPLPVQTAPQTTTQSQSATTTTPQPTTTRQQTTTQQPTMTTTTMTSTTSTTQLPITTSISSTINTGVNDGGPSNSATILHSVCVLPHVLAMVWLVYFAIKRAI